MEICVPVRTDIVDGSRSYFMDPRFYYRDVALVRSNANVVWDDHRDRWLRGLDAARSRCAVVHKF